MDERTIAEVAAWATLAVNALAGAFAGWRWWQVQPSDAVWPLLRAGQAVAVAQALAAGVLFAAGYRPADGLYWLYAVLPVAVGAIAEQLRVASAEQVLEHRGLPDAQAVGTLPELGAALRRAGDRPPGSGRHRPRGGRRGAARAARGADRLDRLGPRAQRRTRVIWNGSIHCGRVLTENRLDWSTYARHEP